MEQTVGAPVKQVVGDQPIIQQLLQKLPCMCVCC